MKAIDKSNSSKVSTNINLFDVDFLSEAMSEEEIFEMFFAKEDFKEFVNGLRAFFGERKVSVKQAKKLYCNIKYSIVIVNNRNSLRDFYRELYLAVKTRKLIKIQKIFNQLPNQSLKALILDRLEDNNTIQFLKNKKEISIPSERFQVLNNLNLVFSDPNIYLRKRGVYSLLLKKEIRFRIIRDIDTFFIANKLGTIYNSKYIKDRGGQSEVHAKSQRRFYGKGVKLIRFIDSFFKLENLLDKPQTFNDLLKIIKNNRNIP